MTPGISCRPDRPQRALHWFVTGCRHGEQGRGQAGDDGEGVRDVPRQRAEQMRQLGPAAELGQQLREDERVQRFGKYVQIIMFYVPFGTGLILDALKL